MSLFSSSFVGHWLYFKCPTNMNALYNNMWSEFSYIVLGFGTSVQEHGCIYMVSKDTVRVKSNYLCQWLGQVSIETLF